MWIRYNEDDAAVDRARKDLKSNGGYCPLKPERSIENKCICKDFRAKISDPNFEGLCQCGLYYKGC